MKVLLLEDVYNLGRAGEVKKVAGGYGRNFLLPQGLAVLATPSAMLLADEISQKAEEKRSVINSEMSKVAAKFAKAKLLFPARAGETGKLYGSVTTQMIAEKLNEETGLDISKRQIDAQPVRQLGMHTVKARLTVDVVPEFYVVVYREGEDPSNYMVDAEELADQIGETGDTGYEEVLVAEDGTVLTAEDGTALTTDASIEAIEEAEEAAEEVVEEMTEEESSEE